MNNLALIGFYITVLLVSVGLTGLVRAYALRSGLIDAPNHRSSHTLPTPSGGGVAIVVTIFIAFLAAYFLLTNLLADSISLVCAWVVAGVVVAAVGFLDDKYTITVKLRMLCHGFAAFSALYLIGVPEITVLSFSLNTGLADYLIFFVFIIWFLNLFNFMDGIDGLAGFEAVTVFLGIVVLLWINGQFTYALPYLVVALSALGFVVWNFPKAKLFMGDVGSGFLGLIIAVSAIYLGHLSSSLFWEVLILAGVFVVDATFTLWRRTYYKQRLSEAHRTHAYQYAARKYNSHVKVTLAVVVINCVWLTPLAVVASLQLIDALLAMLLAYTPLVFLALYFQAGKPEVT